MTEHTKKTENIKMENEKHAVDKGSGYAIEMREVVQNFSGKQVLSGVSLRVKKGEILGLLGPSGAGKTTIVKILTGQLRQTAGEAWLLGTDTRRLKAREYNRIGSMMDNLGLYERLTVYDNLKFYADIYHISSKKVDAALQSVGLYEDRKSTVSRLSKGMCSRLCLARAVMNDAEVLFLDEPTSGLDPSTTREIHKLLLRERDRGAAVFLTTHNMAEAEEICDHVALLNQGEIVEYGRPEEICKKYNRLNRLCIQLKDGNELELENGSGAAEEMMRLLQQEQIETIHSTEPDLETVFVELTGRGLE